jgi:3-deoxy-D-manno-octulosonic-acid transferase
VVLGIYGAGLWAFFVLSLPYFLWKGRKSGKYQATFHERMGHLSADLNPQHQRSIWVHAVSVGEVLAARTLLVALRQRHPGRRLLLSTTTLTGQAIARQSVGSVDGIFFAPFDFRGPVRRVLDVIRPELLVLVETELWPNLIHEAVRRGARVAVVNGRLSPRSFERYRRVRALLRHVLAEVDLFLMQSAPHAERIVALGAPPASVRVSGNLKFDALAAPHVTSSLAQLFRTTGPLIVAGSTVEGEEDAVLRAFQHVRAARPDARLILAPRHPERCDGVVPLVESLGLSCMRRSTLQPGAWTDEVVLLDTLGELAQLYELAAVVFVGGSLVPAGGHNILEPAVAGKTVVIGPHMQNFQEIADAFRAEDALVTVASPAELGPMLLALLQDESRCAAIGARARALVERNRGAVERSVQALMELVA